MRPLGGVLGPLEGRLEASWRRLGASGGILEGSWTRLGARNKLDKALIQFVPRRIQFVPDKTEIQIDFFSFLGSLWGAFWLQFGTKSDVKNKTEI